MAVWLLVKAARALNTKILCYVTSGKQILHVPVNQPGGCVMLLTKIHQGDKREEAPILESPAFCRMECLLTAVWEKDGILFFIITFCLQKSKLKTATFFISRSD